MSKVSSLQQRWENLYEEMENLAADLIRRGAGNVSLEDLDPIYVMLAFQDEETGEAFEEPVLAQPLRLAFHPDLDETPAVEVVLLDGDEEDEAEEDVYEIIATNDILAPEDLLDLLEHAEQGLTRQSN